MYLHIIILYLACFFGIVNAQEVIKSFENTVDIHTDGSITVYEKITVTSARQEIKRGIIRSLPTRYTLLGIFNATVNFTITSARHNGKPTPYHIVNTFSGREIHLGGDTLLQPGIQIYEIAYSTNRQLGFFKKHDEFYWNAIGTEWEFPILIGSITVNLPSTIPAETITAEAYVGKYGKKKTNYQITRQKTSITFTTTKPLSIHEGMTIVVTWPKGFITEPTWYQKIIWFFHDNWVALWALIWLLFALCLYIAIFIHSRRQRNPGTIIPLFYPPIHMTPATVMFIHKTVFDNTSIAPEVIYAAVQGYITIIYDESKKLYTITRTQKDVPLNTYDAGLIWALFNSYETITISKKDSSHIIKMSTFLKNHCTGLYSHYIHHYTTALNWALAFSIIAIVPFTAVHIGSDFTTVIDIIDITCFIILVSLYALISKITRGYTPEGQKLADQIAGFKLFLETTETERLKIIGTPPTKTPELYEHYLPYAMVLGVEEAWTRQFTPLFTALAQQGTPYKPHWYIGSHWNTSVFTRGISTSLQANLPKTPGWSSGAGGKGFSGGGGGGGGGRGR